MKRERRPGPRRGRMGGVPSPRLVATDLDGTLVRSDGRVSPRTRAALDQAREAGACVVFVTGRPVRWMADVVADTGLAGHAICSNGALLVDLATGRAVLRRLLRPDLAVAVGERLRAALPGLVFAVEREDGFAREAEYSPRFDRGLEHEVAPLAGIASSPLLKLLGRHERSSSDELVATARRVLDGEASVTHSTDAGRGGLLEVAAPGVTKASTLAAYADRLGLGAADVVAFGDMPNDLEMLAWAGTAYAMANAHPDVLAAVQRVAPPNDEDGVAQVLEQLYR
jgi:Cof subfamily protein (haloacid dehalogenase superfamily)